MKKSVYTFGLLASSLVMLAVMPFLNNNNSFFSSTAMAQEYNDNYYVDSSYSTYPTDDKKYECRTGPFEGFFVSSVEFCKHVKFDKDDRKDHGDRDNKTITIGLYTVVGNISTGLPGSIIPSTARCDAGDFATGGSFVVGPSTSIVSSQPLGMNFSTPPTGWVAIAEIEEFNATIPEAPVGSVTADAICIDNPPLRP